MITVRQIDRLWSAKAYDRLLDQLIAPRPETSDRLLAQLSGSLPAAAMAVIRLDELSQSFVPLYSQLLQTIISAQRPDGGWGDVMVSAICLRALLCGNGNGVTIERGLASLASLQKPEGIWPSMPVRRMPVDPFASAYLMLCLGSFAGFRQAVRWSEAAEWFIANQLALDDQTRRLWSQAQRRLPAVAHNRIPVSTAHPADDVGISAGSRMSSHRLAADQSLAVKAPIRVAPLHGDSKDLNNPPALFLQPAF